MIAADRLERAGRAYFRLIPLAGVCVLGWALLDLFLTPPSPAWLALAALTVLTGSFTVKIPGLVARLSVSEPFVFRSEERTSELQSPCNLVCRLLLAKKNQT